jgi:hypothetical protein
MKFSGGSLFCGVKSISVTRSLNRALTLAHLARGGEEINMDKFFDRFAKALASPTTRRGFFRKAAVVGGATAAGVLGARPASASCAGPPLTQCTAMGYYSKTYESNCVNPNWCVPNGACMGPQTSDTYSATFNYYRIKIFPTDVGIVCYESAGMTKTGSCDCS